jgi:hypothetical protein
MYCMGAKEEGRKENIVSSGQKVTTASGVVIVEGSQTLGKARKPPKGPQRHSAGNIDYDNSTATAGAEPTPAESSSSHHHHHHHHPPGFRSRSKTLSDASESTLQSRMCMLQSLFICLI